MPNQQNLTPYKSNGYHGLLRGTEVALPARYHAVWALPYGFWGFRQGERFGVLAGTGQLASACVLPAVLPGFTELTVDEELEFFLEPEGSLVPFAQRRFPNLHQRHRVLCRPIAWLAEDVTPHLLAPSAREEYEELMADEEFEEFEEFEPESLWLYADDHTLELRPDGGWTRHTWTYELPRLYYRAQLPAHCFTTTTAQSVRPAEIEDLLRWRLRLHELAEGGTDPTAGDNLHWLITDVQQQAASVAGWQQLLTASGIQQIGAAEEEDLPLAPEFSLAALPAAARAACEAHLTTIFEVNADSQPYVERLIYLAWLWANDLVFYDPEDGLHWVDGRYEFDNGLFDHAIIDNIYGEYALHKLRDLLRLPDLPQA
jgi:hypothetical protein